MFRNHSLPLLSRTTPLFFLYLLVVALLLPAVSSAQINPSHPENPFDQVGRWHNEALDDLIRDTSSLRPRPISFLLASHELLETGASARTGVATDVETARFSEVAALLQSPDASTADLGAAFDDETRIYFEELVTTADASVAVRDGEVSEEQMRLVIDDLRDFESRALVQLGEERARPLLMGASVARHSLVYWSRQIELGERSGWHRFVVEAGTGAGGGLAAKELPSVTKADMLGGVAGAISGAAAGAAAGGIGAGPGAVRGAFIGAAGASAAMALWEFVSSWF